jgi:hypothetical protein
MKKRMGREIKQVRNAFCFCVAGLGTQPISPLFRARALIQHSYSFKRYSYGHVLWYFVGFKAVKDFTMSFSHQGLALGFTKIFAVELAKPQLCQCADQYCALMWWFSECDPTISGGPRILSSVSQKSYTYFSNFISV